MVTYCLHGKCILAAAPSGQTFYDPFHVGKPFRN